MKCEVWIGKENIHFVFRGIENENEMEDRVQIRFVRRDDWGLRCKKYNFLVVRTVFCSPLTPSRIRIVE